MRAVLVGVFAVVVIGCEFGVTTCETDAVCGDGTCVDGFCVAPDAGSGGGGGTGEGQIVAVGGTKELQERYTAEKAVDASGKVVCPGFVDPHTHVVYAGDRIDEFELRIRGASYMEIMAAGVASSAPWKPPGGPASKNWRPKPGRAWKPC